MKLNIKILYVAGKYIAFPEEKPLYSGWPVIHEMVPRSWSDARDIEMDCVTNKVYVKLYLPYPSFPL